MLSISFEKLMVELVELIFMNDESIHRVSLLDQSRLGNWYQPCGLLALHLSMRYGIL